MSSANHVDPAVSPNLVRKAGFLCYVNGIRVPVVSVRVESGANQIPYANISFYPSKYLIRLGAGDRVSVAIFYLDTNYNPDDPTYRLLFDGEVIGWDYTSSGSNRALSVTAAADISALDQVQYSFLNTVDGLAAGIASPTASTTLTDTGVFYPYSLFQDGLLYPLYKDGSSGKEEAKASPTIKTPYDLLYNAVRAMTASGEKIPDSQKTLPVINFFQRWAARRKFNARFVRLRYFDEESGDDGVFPILKAAKAAAAMDTLQEKAAGLGSDGSLYDILKQLFQSVYYEIAALPTAPYLTVTGDGLPQGRVPKKKSKGADKQKKRLANYYAKPQALFAIPPTCNVLFPSLIRNLTYAENYRTQPTRLYLLDGHMASVVDPGIAEKALTWAWPPAAKAAMEARNPETGTGKGPSMPASTGKNILIWPEEFYKGPVSQRGRVPELFGLLARDFRTAVKDSDAEKQQTIRTLMSIYAQYEYSRIRYSERGGAADLVFNPYVVPGYPAVLFDRPGGLDQVGYVHSVVHSLSGQGMSTYINYSSGRTVNEWLATIKSDVERLGVSLGSAPAEPVDEVRQVLQNYANAEEFYKCLFFGGAATVGAGRSAAFDITQVLTSGGRSINIPRTPNEKENPIKSRTQGTPSKSKPGAKTSVSVDPTDEISATQNYAKLFKNTNDALRYVARPICTLTEYVEFINAGNPKLIDALKAKRISVDGAFVYPRIQELKYSKYSVKDTETGYGETRDTTESETDLTATLVSTHTNAKGLPDNAADWSSVLIAYRDEIEKAEQPLE